MSDSPFINSSNRSSKKRRRENSQNIVNETEGESDQNDENISPILPTKKQQEIVAEYLGLTSSSEEEEEFFSPPPTLQQQNVIEYLWLSSSSEEEYSSPPPNLQQQPLKADSMRESGTSSNPIILEDSLELQEQIITLNDSSDSSQETNNNFDNNGFEEVEAFDSLVVNGKEGYRLFLPNFQNSDDDFNLFYCFGCKENGKTTLAKKNKETGKIVAEKTHHEKCNPTEN